MGLDTKLECFSQTTIPLEWGEFDVRVYKDPNDQSEVFVVSQGRVSHTDDPIFVRIHSECLTGEVFHSLKCDCREQLQAAMDDIAKAGQGLLIYLRQEGRGIGLGQKIRAYELQKHGHDTVTANLALGFEEDSRSFTFACDILKSLGLKNIKINTNNPEKIIALESEGFHIVERVPSAVSPQKHNISYLQTKKQKLGHQLDLEAGEKT
ncbi:MAG: GTP cyclohydrolase II [Oligoflexales bacterium]